MMISRKARGESDSHVRAVEHTQRPGLPCLREKDSSLQDLETRYGKSIERIALLEEELVSKAQLEEETQRLKDELRGGLGFSSR